MNGFAIAPLDESRWDMFAALVERNGVVFGGCWSRRGLSRGRGSRACRVLFNGALSTDERPGFVRDRPIGTHRWVVRRAALDESGVSVWTAAVGGCDRRAMTSPRTRAPGGRTGLLTLAAVAVAATVLVLPLGIVADLAVAAVAYRRRDRTVALALAAIGILALAWLLLGIGTGSSVSSNTGPS